ncbi:MAG: HAD family hydrolase [Pigmentiphaga sp.]
MTTPLVLFDFDGTLADTAPGLAAAANRQRAYRDLGPLPYDRLRPVASQGARGLLRVALGLHPEDAGYDEARIRFLADYAELMYDHSALFAEVPQLLASLNDAGLRWGIVTNKQTTLAEPLVAHLQLAASVVVCGDTTPHAKPHPAPLLHAAAALNHPPEHCLYVGDDLRDVQAGHAAGMITIAAAWGYCGDEAPVESWQAHHIAPLPLDTLAVVRARANLAAAKAPTP